MIQPSLLCGNPRSVLVRLGLIQGSEFWHKNVTSHLPARRHLSLITILPNKTNTQEKYKKNTFTTAHYTG